MARIEEWRLDPARYPNHLTVQTRFQDVDMLGHINNVAFGALFESARVRFNHLLGLPRWREHRWLVARVEINYLAEAYHPAEIDIHTGIGTIGTRSWRIDALALQDGRAVATCEAVLVMEAQQGITGLPAEFRERLEAYRVTAPD